MNRYTVFILAFFGTVHVSATRIEKPRIGVSFKITEKEYVSSLGSLRTTAEKELQKRIIRSLSDAYPFIDFIDSATTDRLEVFLARKKQGDTIQQVSEVGFWFQVNSNGQLVSQSRHYWKFRDVIYYTRSIKPLPNLYTEAMGVFESKLSQSPNELVSRCLSKIKLADKVLPFLQLKALILPYKKHEVGIDDQSRFNVYLAYTDPLGPVSDTLEFVARGPFRPSQTSFQEYVNNIRTNAVDPQPGLEILGDSTALSTMQIKGVYLIYYLPYKPPLATPEDF